jgi:hypothetical protein
VRAGAMKFTSRILEGLMAQRGLVERWEGIGCYADALAQAGAAVG